MRLYNRATLVRNLAVSLVNGTITLVILLIAPLGLASVITNTFLVTAATYFTASIADYVVRFLSASKQPEIISRRSDIRVGNSDSLERRARDRNMG